MTPQTLRPANVAAAALVLGGVLTVAFPQHALGITQLVLVTIAAGAGLYALAANVPPTGWISPFKWLSPFGGDRRPERRMHGSDEIESIRSKLAGRRQRLEGAPPLPPDVLRLLRPLVAGSLEIDPDDKARLASVLPRLPPTTRAILTTEPLPRSYWLTTLRPNAWEVAEVVHEVLDELHRLPAASAEWKQPTTIHDQPRIS